jgi:hypothetical protein
MHNCYAKLPKRLPTKESQQYKEPKDQQTQRLYAAQVIRLDSWALMQWNIISHAGFLTHHHKDANGLCTWMYAHTGVKLWAVMQPVFNDSHNTRRKIHELNHSIMKARSSVDETCVVHTVFLQPGDLL